MKNRAAPTLLKPLALRIVAIDRPIALHAAGGGAKHGLPTASREAVKIFGEDDPVLDLDLVEIGGEAQAAQRIGRRARR